MLSELDQIGFSPIDFQPETRIETALHLDASELPVLRIDDIEDYHGRRISLDDRVEEILLGIEQKYGDWYKNPKNEENENLISDRDGNLIWRKEMGVHLKNALSKYPVTLIAKDNSHDIIACVVSGSDIVVLKKNMHISMRQGLFPMPDFDGEHSNIPLPIDDPASVFYWSRKINPENLWIDPVFDRFFDKISASKTFESLDKKPWIPNTLRFFCSFTPKNNTRKIYKGQITERYIDLLSNQEFNHSKTTRAQYALGAIISKIIRSASFAFSAAVRRLVNKPVLNFARRFGNLDVYPWLVAIDYQKTSDIDNQALISTRRMQFARAYPEIVRSLVSRSFGIRIMGYNIFGRSSDYFIESTELCDQLQSAIDHAQPVIPIIKKIRNWPVWVERSLRGKLFPTNACGLFDGMENELARVLTELGPEWRLRGGDTKIAGIIIKICLDLKINFKKTHDQAVLNNRSSPWKQLYKKLPEEFTNIIANQKDTYKSPNVFHITCNFIPDIQDFKSAFIRDIISPLLGHHAPLHTIEKSKLDRISKLLTANTGLLKLIDQSNQWHQRYEAIQRAKEGQKSGATQELNTWLPLFHPFSWIEGKIEIKSITEKYELQAHGKEMNHCVGGYSYSCQQGGCHIIGFFSKQKPIATAELRGYSGHQIQMRAAKNGKVNQPEQDALDWISNQLKLANSVEDDRVEDDWDFEWYQDSNPVNNAKPKVYNQEDHVLCTLRVSDLKLATGKRMKVIKANRKQVRMEYDWNNPIAVEQVIVAWRFALPESMRTAWEKGSDPVERVENAKRWLIESIKS